MKGSGCKQNFSDEGVLERVASENTYRDPPGDPPLLRIDCRLLLWPATMPYESFGKQLSRRAN